MTVKFFEKATGKRIQIVEWYLINTFDGQQRYKVYYWDTPHKNHFELSQNEIERVRLAS